MNEKLNLDRPDLDRLRALDFFRGEMEKGLTSCYAVAVRRGKETVLQHQEGRLWPEDDAPPVTDRTRFNIGSVTKIITGALILKLAELGECTLFDSVKRYFPSTRLRSRHFISF